MEDLGKCEILILNMLEAAQHANDEVPPSPAWHMCCICVALSLQLDRGSIGAL